MKLSDLTGTPNTNEEEFVFAIDTKDGAVPLDCGVPGELELEKPEEIHESKFIRYGTGSRKLREPTEEEIKERIKSYDHEIKDGVIYLHCVCDGTMAFLYDMLSLLNAVGCTELQYQVEEITYRGEGLCTRFFVRGKVPEGFDL